MKFLLKMLESCENRTGGMFGGRRTVSGGTLRARCLSAEALRFLLTYPWPGNVRELENTLLFLPPDALGCREELFTLLCSLDKGRFMLRFPVEQ